MFEFTRNYFIPAFRRFKMWFYSNIFQLIHFIDTNNITINVKRRTWLPKKRYSKEDKPISIRLGKFHFNVKYLLWIKWNYSYAQICHLLLNSRRIPSRCQNRTYAVTQLKATWLLLLLLCLLFAMIKVSQIKKNNWYLLHRVKLKISVILLTYWKPNVSGVRNILILKLKNGSQVWRSKYVLT